MHQGCLKIESYEELPKKCIPTMKNKLALLKKQPTNMLKESIRRILEKKIFSAHIFYEYANEFRLLP